VRAPWSQSLKNTIFGGSIVARAGLRAVWKAGHVCAKVELEVGVAAQERWASLSGRETLGRAHCAHSGKGALPVSHQEVCPTGQHGIATGKTSEADACGLDSGTSRRLWSRLWDVVCVWEVHGGWRHDVCGCVSRGQIRQQLCRHQGGECMQRVSSASGQVPCGRQLGSERGGERSFRVRDPVSRGTVRQGHGSDIGGRSMSAVRVGQVLHHHL
jgi:hypothetical protein